MRVGAPALSKPLQILFNESLIESVVPKQWKCASIIPIPKVPSPKTPSDYRPISITSVLSRTLERLVVRLIVYPALKNPPPPLSFNDHFAIRPGGSTNSALIYLLHTVTAMLEKHPFVRVFALDFSKAFDTIRHTTLVEKLAMLDLPHEIFNWITNFLECHSHCTKFNGSISELADISASVIQGSVIGPPAFLVSASDLHPLTNGNQMMKYADDSYLIIPASNAKSATHELENVANWSSENNLTLNHSKSSEIIFTSRRSNLVTLPPPVNDIPRVTEIISLGVTLSANLGVTAHVHDVVTRSAQSLYALRIMRAHGMKSEALHAVFQATTLAKLLYCAQAWWGFANQSDRSRIEAFLNKSKRLNFCSHNCKTFSKLVEDSDNALFQKIICDVQNPLHHLLPPKTEHQYNLRDRTHNFRLPKNNSSTSDKNFLTRMLYKNCY